MIKSPPLKGGKGGGKGSNKGSKSSNPLSTESAPDTVPPAESTATDKPDILDLTTEEQEVEVPGVSFPPFCLQLIQQVSHLVTNNFRIPKKIICFPKKMGLIRTLSHEKTFKM